MTGGFIMKKIRKVWSLKDQARLLKRLGEMTAGIYASGWITPDGTSDE